MEAMQLTMFDAETYRAEHTASVVQISEHPRYVAKKEEVQRAPVKALSTTHVAQPIRSIEQIQLIEDALLTSSKIFGIRNRAIFSFGICTGRRCGDILSVRVGDVWDENKRAVRLGFQLEEEKTGKRPLIGISPELAPVLREYIDTLEDKRPESPLFPSRKISCQANETAESVLNASVRVLARTAKIPVKNIWMALNKELEETYMIEAGLRGSTSLVRYVQGLTEDTNCTMEKVRACFDAVCQKIGFIPDTIIENALRFLHRNDGCLETKSFWKIMKRAGDQLGVSHLSTHSMRKTFGYTFYMQFQGTTIEDQYGALEMLQMLFGHSSPSITLRYIGITEDACLRMYQELKMYNREPRNE